MVPRLQQTHLCLNLLSTMAKESGTSQTQVFNDDVSDGNHCAVLASTRGQKIAVSVRIRQVVIEGHHADFMSDSIVTAATIAL